MITSIDHIAIAVTNLDEAVKPFSAFSDVHPKLSR